MELWKLAMRLRSHAGTAAVIELVVVVVGILVAPEASNRSRGRVDRARADSCQLVPGH